MFVWFPNKKSADRVVDNFDEKLYSAVRSSLSDLAREEDVSFFIEDNFKAHPEVYQWQYNYQSSEEEDLNSFIDQNSPLNIKENIAQSRKRAKKNEKKFGFPLDTAWPGADKSRTETRAKKILENLGENDPNFTFNSMDQKKVAECLVKAFDLLEDIWPEQLDEIKSLLQIAVIFKCDKAIGFTDVETNGVIYIKEESVDDPVELAELIVHEVAHGYLNMLFASETLFLNDNEEKFSSPLRPDPRPMFGVFHQLFVLMRLREFYKKVHSIDDRYDEKLEKINLSTEEAFSTVSQHAILTQAGKELVNSMEKELKIPAKNCA